MEAYGAGLHVAGAAGPGEVGRRAGSHAHLRKHCEGRQPARGRHPGIVQRVGGVALAAAWFSYVYGSPRAERISAARSRTSSDFESFSNPSVVDGDRERRGPHGAPVGRGRPGRGGSCGRRAGGPGARSSAAPPGSWKPTRSAPSSPSRSCRRQGSCWKARPGERDVQEEADPQVGPQLAQHLRDQLELVVVHPDRGVLGRPLGGVLGEAPVDRDVGVPPLAVELRLGDQVVVERPERAAHNATVWVQDYQLQLVPQQLRELRPDLRIGSSCRIPFPPAGCSARYPWRGSSSKGCSGDLVGFQMPGGAAKLVRLVRQRVGRDLVYLPDDRTCGPRRSRI